MLLPLPLSLSFFCFGGSEKRMQYYVPAKHSMDLYEEVLEIASQKRLRWLWKKAILCVRAIVLFKKIAGDLELGVRDLCDLQWFVW